jgi:hypothetical protein
MRKRPIERWMLSFLTLLLASECLFVAVLGSCGSFLVFRVSATDSHRYARIGNPTVSAAMVGQPSYVATITRASADSTITEIRGGAGSYDVTVAKAGYTSVTQRAVVSDRGSCLSPRPVDLDVVMTPLSVR